MKTRYYIIDGLVPTKAIKLYKALGTVVDIISYSVDDIAGIVKIESKKDCRKQLDLACGIFSLTVRIEIYKNDM